MGKPLANVRVFGKPHAEAYRMVETLLSQQAQALQERGGRTHDGKPRRFGSIVAVGDNPASDIAGAAAAGALATACVHG